MGYWFAGVAHWDNLNGGIKIFQDIYDRCKTGQGKEVMSRQRVSYISRDYGLP